jgi:signal transduction histidine kinase
MAKKGESQLFEWRVRDKSRKELWVEMNIRSAIIGDSYRLLLIIRDITERKRHEGLKDNFIANVSHELRTPLAAIKEAVSLVSEGLAHNNEMRLGCLEIAQKNIDRLSRLINNVLDFQKLELGKVVFKMQDNDLNEVVRECHEMMLPLAQEKGIEFTVKPDDKLPKVKFDKDKIMEVLSNIVNNAVKFTAKGNITITTSRGEIFVQVSVKDDGIGIGKDDLAKLFQRFAQFENSTYRKKGSTGLGLAISKEIIESHHGKIWAESEPGKGSVFSFLLPIVERRKIL